MRDNIVRSRLDRAILSIVCECVITLYVPGQIELYTHVPVMRQLVEQLHSWNFYVCGVFLLDAQFMIEPSKFVSGVLSALSTMVNLEIPHINIITKLDLLNKSAKKDLERFVSSFLGAYYLCLIGCRVMQLVPSLQKVCIYIIIIMSQVSNCSRQSERVIFVLI